MFYSFQNFAQVKNWRYQQYWGHLSLEKKKKEKIHFCQQDHSFHNSEVHIPVTSYIFCVWVLSAPITVIQAKCCLFVESFDQKLNETKSRNISWCLAQRCWYNTSKYAFNPQCKGIFFELLLDSVLFFYKKDPLLHSCKPLVSLG